MAKTKIFFFIFLFFFSFNLAKAQSPISDLYCEPGEIEGAIWLSWTVPFEIASNFAYELRYSQGSSIYYEWALIYNPSQNWSSGIPGMKKRELVRGLNPGAEFTFALRWKNESEEWSLFSNKRTCFAALSSKIDKSPPEFEIKNLKSGDNIFEKENFKIEGWAKDVGNSSVKKVEVSFDKKNWEKADSVKNLEGKLFWQYWWKDPQAGEYKIFFRSSDWLDNISQPKEISVKVIAKEKVQEKEKKEEISLEKPISEMTVEELKLKIKEIQEKVIILLKKLIELLSQEISELKK